MSDATISHIGLFYWIYCLVRRQLQRGCIRTGTFRFPDPVPNDSVTTMTESDNEPDRVIWQKPDMILDLLGNLSDKVVADIGAGTGFFTFRLLQHAGKVIAVDIDKVPLDRMSQLSRKLDTAISNKLEIKLAKPNDPELKPASVDVIFMSNTYMYIQNRVPYLKNLIQYLKPHARILIIDYKRNPSHLVHLSKNGLTWVRWKKS